MLLIIDNQSNYLKSFKRNFLSEQDFEYLVFDHNQPLVLPKNAKVQGIILSGGKGNPYEPLNLTTNFIALKNYDVPVFGFCLGHEIIAVLHQGRIHKLGEYQNKKEKVIITKPDDPIFKGFDTKEVMLQERHTFEVSHLPPNFEVLAHSEICKYEIIRHKEKPIYGFQSHPEVSKPHGIIMIENFLKICGLK